MLLLGTRPLGGKLEPYFPRDVDQALDKALKRPGLVLVIHETSSGSRRTLYEALLRQHPELPLWLSTSVSDEDSRAAPLNAVLWMDLVARAPAGIRAVSNSLRRWLMPGRYAVVLVGTAYSRLSELVNELGALSPMIVNVDNQFTDAEKSRAQSKFATEVHDVADLASLAEKAHLLNPYRHAAGYHADTDEGTDLLDVTADVRMLADVVASRLIRPPLSIGLFGNWGSGKSFFMRQMRTRVRALSDAAAAAEGTARMRGRPVSSYCSTVRQITFNAWHYAEANLLASLATHIFDSLAASGSEEVLRRRADDLAEMRRTERSLLTQLSAVRLERRLVAAQQERRPVRLDLTRDDFAWVAQELGVPEASTTDVRQFVTELDGFGVEARRVWTLLRRSRFALFMGVIAVVLAVVLGVLVRSPTWPVLAGGLSLLVGVTPVVSRVREAMARIRRAAESADAAVDQRLTALDEESARLERAVAELATGRDATAFAKSRYESGDYRSHLGIVSLLRRDLETFAAILDKERNTDGGLERIILYVDDLDRCQPAVVVKVLEAVHLLVALPVFVVVVAVDPRWLHQAIRLHYSTMVPDGSVTPAQYLEKIFQIPFQLSPMDAKGYDRLIRDMSKADEDTEFGVVTVGRNEEIGTPVLLTGEGSADDALTTLAPSPQPRLELRPRQLHVSETELDFLSSLATLVPSPRAAKRLMNLYRLVRARMSTRELDLFVQNGDFRAVLVLLALHADAGSSAYDRFDAEPDLKWLTELVGVELHKGMYRGWLPLVRRFSFGHGNGPQPEPRAIQP